MKRHRATTPRPEQSSAQPASAPRLTAAETQLAARRETTAALWPRVPIAEHVALASRVCVRFGLRELPSDWADAAEHWQLREAAIAAWGMEKKRRREAARDELPPIATPRPVTMTKERETRLIDATRRTTAAVSRGESVPDALWEYT